ncbi:MAG: ABC transporter substrate-binding protein [Thermosynechococcaceae cyanobacterium]
MIDLSVFSMARLRSRWLIVFLATASLLILTNCGSGPQTNRTPDGTLVFASAGQPVNLEPGNITDGNSIYVQQQIYDRLVHVQPGETKLIPGLAREWNASNDGLTWTFKLREGVQFHDGTPFNASAVKDNIERWWDPQSPLGFRDAGKTYEIWANLFGGFKGDEVSLLQAVKVVDAQAIEFVLKQPFAGFPAALSSGYFGMASPAAIKKAAGDYGVAGSVAVGTGPFVFQEWVTGDLIRLQKNPNYWRPDLPKAEQLIIRFITEPAARLAELRSGTVDFTIDLSPDQQAEIEADPNLEAILRPSFNVGYLALNPSYAPLAKLKVRQAIAHAINRDAIVKAFWNDLATTDNHFTPPALEAFQAKTLPDYPFDPAKAKQLLAEAGYPNGFDLELWYMPVSRPYYPTPKPISEAFASDLSKVGINVSLKTKDWAAYLSDRNRQPGFQSFMLGWTGDYSDPDNFYYPHFGPGATTDLGLWQNDQILELLDQARQVADPSERIRLYAQVDQILAQELVRLPIVHSQPLLAKRTTVTGWTPSPLGTESLEQLR